MSSDTKFDELFALRVLLQDEFENEYDIIRELKYNLLQQGMSIQNIPNHIKEFYEAFNINITDDQINEILEPNETEQLTNQMINLINQMINEQIVNINNVNNNEENNNEYNEEDYIENNEEDNEENNDEDNKENNDEDNIENNDEHNIENNDEDNIENNNEDNGENNDEDNGGNNEENTNPNISHIQIYISPLDSGEPIQYTYNINSPPLNINSFLGNFLNPSILGLGAINSVTQDVVSTLDESEKDKLKVYKLSENKEEKCSVCMSDMNTDEHVCELPCNHTFHNNCIQPWLQQYNYKCPICRKEVGKPKHNI